MIIYVNGDSHSAGYDAGGQNFSYGKHLATNLKAEFFCVAEAGSSNSRIIRTTQEYIKYRKPDLIVIGWSTWEREEWFYDNRYWQINVSGIDTRWPEEIKEKYRTWITTVDWKTATSTAHEQIHNFHLTLLEKNIPHLFFNCYSDFRSEPQKIWHNSYINPYDPTATYYTWLTNQGFESNDLFHFGADAHEVWATHLTKIINESIITK